MDDFTKKWLLNIGFKHLISTFEEEDIDKKALFLLTESMLVNLVSKMGQRANFINELEKLKNPIEIIQIEKESQFTLLMNVDAVVDERDISYNVAGPSKNKTSDPVKIITKRNSDNLNPNKKIKCTIFDNLSENENSNSDNCSDLIVEEISSEINSSKGINPNKNIKSTIFDNLSVIEASNSDNCSDLTIEENSSKINSTKDNFIKHILKKYQDGVIILQYYASNGTLCQKMRNRLCGVVIKDAIYNTEGANKINRSQFSKIAKLA
ncbi:uncharacterized protein LOC132933624 [Metopolophium dirhodum]|uniref:uncharacterized protein LOC132933624 n=1 Tax=Metopolophium dirhodum TaxID=44670 RepID=UPI00298F46AE|nr:uncharacterized protein LOC132933624 [Metopolophium dirhodum]